MRVLLLSKKADDTVDGLSRHVKKVLRPLVMAT